MTRLRAVLARLRARADGPRGLPAEPPEPLRLDAVDSCRRAPYLALLERRRRPRR